MGAMMSDTHCTLVRQLTATAHLYSTLLPVKVPCSRAHCWRSQRLKQSHYVLELDGSPSHLTRSALLMDIAGIARIERKDAALLGCESTDLSRRTA